MSNAPFHISFLIHLLQATMFGALIVGVLLVSQNLSARLRHILGWLGLFKFVFPLSMMGIAIPFIGPRLASAEWLPAMLVSGAWSDSAIAANTEGVYWRMAGGIWAVGLIVMLSITVWRTIIFIRRLRAERVPFTVEHAQQLYEAADIAGVNQTHISGWMTTGATSPGVSGIFRSRIHVPRELMLILNRKEIEAVLLHELMHVARRDNLLRMIQTVIVCVFWFHPLVWWLHSRLILESERSCDELVVRKTRDGDAYAQGMIKAARFALGLEVAGFSGMARNGLSVRLAAILKPNIKKDHPMLRLTLILVTLGGFIMSAGATAPKNEKNYSMLQTDFAPRPIERTPPIYPSELRSEGIAGKVVVEFIVDSTGAVKNCTVVESSRPEFEAPAVDAVSQWKFLPGIKGGRNVNTRLRVPIVFALRK